MAGFLLGWLTDKSYEQTCTYANASGALVVSRHGCAPAIPTPEELAYYIKHQDSIKRPDLDPELNYLHRVTTRTPVDWGELCILAFDHRIQLVDMAKEVGADLSRIGVLKQHIMNALLDITKQDSFVHQAGVLIDDTFGQDALNTVTGQGLWIGRPVELPASRPLELEGGRSIGSRLVTWPKEHVVKCLVFMHPQDEPEMWQAQSRQLLELYQACCTSGHELLLEIIPPKDMPSDDDSVVLSMQMIYDLNIRPDWWKLPAPSKTAWEKISHLVETSAPHCRGVILLGLDAPFNELIKGFADSANYPLCKGFAVGRSIFSSPSKAWLAGQISDEQLKLQISQNYNVLVDAWNKRKEH
jgi:5-dehydro-2-deoxygluconokinase